MNITDIISMVGQNIWIYGGSLVLVLSILVFVHEWGHYIIARMNGVRVETFSIGFGKEIWGFNDKAGTRWKVSLIPLGGYVQLFGDTDPASAGNSDAIKNEDGTTRPMSEEELKEAFFTKPIWKRAAVVVAGPAINYIFAIMLLTGLYYMHGKPVSPPTAAAVIIGGSADKNGFQPHDFIVSIDGKHMDSFGDLRREMMVALDQEKHFVIRRDGQMIDIYAKPNRITSEDRFGFKSSSGVLGIISAEQGILLSSINKIDGIKYSDTALVIAEISSRLDTSFTISFAGEQDLEGRTLKIHPTKSMNADLGNTGDVGQEALYLSNMNQQTVTPHTLITALQSATVEAYVMTRSSLEALWQMVTGVRSATELGGIIRIGAVAGDMAQQGIVPLILLTALLSINLGFINLLPIPMLDGGHLLFYFIESVIGRPVPAKIQEYSFNAGFIFLIGVMAFANLNDLYQIIM